MRSLISAGCTYHMVGNLILRLKLSMEQSILNFKGLQHCILSWQSVKTPMNCCLIMQHFIWVFTVCKRTCLEAWRMKRVQHNPEQWIFISISFNNCNIFSHILTSTVFAAVFSLTVFQPFFLQFGFAAAKSRLFSSCLAHSIVSMFMDMTMDKLTSNWQLLNLYQHKEVKLMQVFS